MSWPNEKFGLERVRLLANLTNFIPASKPENSSIEGKDRKEPRRV